MRFKITTFTCDRCGITDQSKQDEPRIDGWLSVNISRTFGSAPVSLTMDSYILDYCPECMAKILERDLMADSIKAIRTNNETKEIN